MARFEWTYDELVLAADLVARNEWKALRAHYPQAIELSDLLRSATIHPVEGRPWNFRSVNSIQRKTYDIATQHPDYTGQPTRGGRSERDVLLAFLREPERMGTLALAIREQITETPDGPPPSDPDMDVIAAHEGRESAVIHLRRERSPRLREAKLAHVRATGRAIACEVCEFDFATTYGEVGDGYIEVHHVLPLHASGPVVTRLEDLALLCSNCHRMIHRARPWLTPEQLGEKLEKR